MGLLLLSKIFVFGFNFTLNLISPSPSLYGTFFLFVSSKNLFSSSNWSSSNTRVRVLNCFFCTPWMGTCRRNGWMRNESRRTSISTRTTIEYGYVFLTGRMKRKWKCWIWWLMILLSSMKWQRNTSWMGCVIIPSVSSLSWHTTSCGHRMEKSRYSISPLIDWVTFVSFTKITSIIG